MLLTESVQGKMDNCVLSLFENTYGHGHNYASIFSDCIFITEGKTGRPPQKLVHSFNSNEGLQMTHLFEGRVAYLIVYLSRKTFNFMPLLKCIL